MRILFVDDDPQMLDGLRDLLRRRRHEWSMSFALGPEAALLELEQSAFDVVVTDVRMPGIDGATLLERVRERQPQAVRIVLSGQMESTAALRTARIAHRFLAKPCDYAELVAAIDDARDRRARLHDPEIRAIVTSAIAVPSAPVSVTELVEILSSEDTSAASVAALVARDIGMTAKVLQLVNSSFFALGRSISDVREAVAYLGTETVKALALSVEVFRAFEQQPHAPLGLDELERHSAAVAHVAARLAAGRCADTASVAAGALLHDIGKLVVASTAPERLDDALRAAAADERPLYEVEHELFGWTHSDVGAALLGLWNLPNAVIDAVAFHHAPAEYDAATVTPAGLIHVADALVCEDEGRPSGLDHAYVERVGIAATGEGKRRR